MKSSKHTSPGQASYSVLTLRMLRGKRNLRSSSTYTTH